MDAIEYLTRVRKLDKAVLDHYGIKGVDHKGMGPSIVFPYRRDGKSYAGKFRCIEKKDWRSTHGTSRGLFNEDALNQNTDLPIVISEGEIDTLSIIQSGFIRAVSLPDGWTEEGNKTDTLLDAEDRLRNSPYVIVAGDSDKAGESLPRVVANILKGHDVRYVTWPDGLKDANDVLMAYSETPIANAVSEAKKIDPVGGFITGFSDLPPMPDRRVMRTGLALFDKVVAYETRAISVLTGTPGSGKSTFSTWIAEMIAVNEGIRVGLMSFETHPHEARDQLSLIRTSKVFNDLDDPSREALLATLDRHFRLVHRTYDKSAIHHLEWIENMVYTLAVREQCKLIIIDPWNELEHLPAKGETMTEYINYALQQLRQLAEQLDIHIQIVAHPKKMNTEGKPRPPDGYDIADSAAFKNKPSLGLTVHQKEDSDGVRFVSVICWKARNARLYGFSKGAITCEFEAERGRFRKRIIESEPVNEPDLF